MPGKKREMRRGLLVDERCEREQNRGANSVGSFPDSLESTPGGKKKHSQTLSKKKTTRAHFFLFSVAANCACVEACGPVSLSFLPAHIRLRTSCAVSSSWEREESSRVERERPRHASACIRRHLAVPTLAPDTSKSPNKAHGALDHLSFSLNLTNNRKKEHRFGAQS